LENAASFEEWNQVSWQGSLRIPPSLFWHERNAKACQRPISFEFDFTNVGEIIRPVATDCEAGGIAQIIAIETEFQ
jgi:hypothetical protein